MTERRMIVLLLAAIAAASFAQAAVCLAQTPMPRGDATFPPGTAIPERPRPLPARPETASPTEQVPRPKPNFDPSLSTTKPEDCVDGTKWHSGLRGCVPPWTPVPD